MSPGKQMTTALLECVDAVLFDLDGTLLDTAPDLVAALYTLCSEEGQHTPPAELASCYVSTGAIGLVRLAFPDSAEERTETLRQRLVELYAGRLCVDTAPYPGILRVLEHLEQHGLPWGIVTNKIAQLTEPLLDHLGFRTRCATVISGDSASHRKPHPAPLLMGLSELGVQPHRTIYIGDAAQDIMAGQAAGLITIAAAWGYILPDQDPLEWQADYTIGQPLELLELRRKS